MSKLADSLDSIASGSTYDQKAISAAIQHAVTTSNDAAMLCRYSHGCNIASDSFRLQDLAMYIREHDIIARNVINKYYTDRQNSCYAALSK
jgi:hypothetical protein